MKKSPSFWGYIFCVFIFYGPANNTFSQTLSHPSEIKIQTDISHPEIWHRTRKHFNISTSQTALLERHVSKLKKSPEYFNGMFKNAQPYLYYILEELEKRGLPSEIAFIPMVESEFNPHDKSHKGAVGLWQIMPQLAKLYGLKRNDWYDQRKDVYESTRVALDHLEYLYKRFNNNWLLAFAAYNAGEYRVLSAMKKNKSAKKPTHFWALKLPKETTHYVPKILAIAAIVKSPQRYGLKLPAIPNQPVFTRINLGKSVNMAQAAKLVNSSEKLLHQLNPALHKKTLHPKGPFTLVVPVHHAIKSSLPVKVNTKLPLNLLAKSDEDYKTPAITNLLGLQNTFSHWA